MSNGSLNYVHKMSNIKFIVFSDIILFAAKCNLK